MLAYAPDTQLSLDEAARVKFPCGTVTGDTLKRKARAGKLTVYKAGKSYTTTLADVDGMIAACRVKQRVQGSGSDKRGTIRPESLPTNPLGLSRMDLASSALDSALAQIKKKKTKRSAIT